MYEICKEVNFAAAHLIRGHPGKCSQPHGHNWRVRIHVECKELDEIGMGVDFGQIKEVLWQILARLDHQNLNELDLFRDLNPTAENIARYLFSEAAKRIDSPSRRVSRVQIWETDSCSVSYSE